MDNMAMKKENEEFDWDNIVVGDFNLDHSENFFAAANKENLINIIKTPKANKKSDAVTVPLDWNGSPQSKAEELQPKVEAEAEDDIIELEVLEDIVIDDETETAITETEQQQERPNLKLEWSTAVIQQDAACHSTAPRAYAFKDVYQNKREEAKRRQAEEERRAREFHSRPAPNFRLYHKRMDEAIVTHFITEPKTPNTIKHWRANLERRKQKEQSAAEEQRRKQAEQLAKARLARSTQYLREPVYQPKKPAHSGTDIKPFQLHSEQRVLERREFDAAVQCSLEQKNKQREEERIKRELVEIKEIRKMTEFKARPNPFK